MPELLIAAIARTSGEAELLTILSQCNGLEASRLTLFTKDPLLVAPARSRMHFIPFQGAAVASSSHGTSVPGIERTLALSAYLVDATTHHLKDMGISTDAANYYNIAIDQGRSVVTYSANAENAAQIEDEFRACGFVKIRRFALNHPKQTGCM